MLWSRNFKALTRLDEYSTVTAQEKKKLRSGTRENYLKLWIERFPNPVIPCVGTFISVVQHL